MRIIKQGTPPEERLHTAICRTCKTEIEFHEIEARRVNDQRDGDFFEIGCPVCKRPITKAAR